MKHTFRFRYTYIYDGQYYKSYYVTLIAKHTVSAAVVCNLCIESASTWNETAEQRKSIFVVRCAVIQVLLARKVHEQSSIPLVSPIRKIFECCTMHCNIAFKLHFSTHYKHIRLLWNVRFNAIVHWNLTLRWTLTICCCTIALHRVTMQYLQKTCIFLSFMFPRMSLVSFFACCFATFCWEARSNSVRCEYNICI